MTTQDLLIDGPEDAAATLVLAHGAGAPMDSDFMAVVAGGLGARGLRVVRFEFPYMAERRRSGHRKPPDRLPALQARFQEVVEQVRRDGVLVIGGKSLGGRVASTIADETRVSGLICLGYPFHPAGHPERLRTAHLAELRTPTLIVQGERDALGSRDEIAGYTLSPAVEIVFLGDGDHSFKPRRKSGRTEDQALAEAVDAVVAFVEGPEMDA